MKVKTGFCELRYYSRRPSEAQMRQFDVFWDCALQLLALAIRAREDGKLLWEEELLKLATEISDQADEMDRHEALSGHLQ